MAQNEQRDAKNGKKTMFSLREKDLFCTDSILLQGGHGAVLYGCERILFYGRERICFSMKGRSVSVFGKDLCCTVFSPVSVSIQGEIAGVQYCSCDYSGRCDAVLGEEGKS
ncbi:MAG: YabP/YqfC family sporulation protein [Clostridia bacterium]|nr:YabP/YqfC family sporulation protein [Clostridia bacterium]